MKILIATGIYPPALGGPAKYAYHLKHEWEKMGHTVTVQTYTHIEHALPTFLRHIYYFLKIIPDVFSCDFVYALDTFSVGLPATGAALLLNKKILVRTGGDFLWEGYVERTGHKILLKDFYVKNPELSPKEKIIFNMTKWVTANVDALIFSTTWQRDIWQKPYNLGANVSIIENFYGSKVPALRETREKTFIGGTRKIQWKNLDILEKAFEKIAEAKLDVQNYAQDHFQQKIQESYATILVSLGDISPNMILESIRFNKPFIITKENGLMDRIASCALTVDPLDVEDIRNKVLWLCDEKNYAAQIEKIMQFNFTHTWPQIAQETLDLYARISKNV